MAIRRNRRFHVEIASGAMSDIMFFLLLFFLIISTLANPNVVKIPLPEAEANMTTKKAHLNLNVKYEPVSQRYTYSFDGDSTKVIPDDPKLSTLGSALMDETTKRGDKVVIIRFDKNAQAQKLVDLIKFTSALKLEPKLGVTNPH